MSSDAKAVNFQAGSEGGMTALCAALLGADSLIAAGSIDGVQISSLAKVMLDCDQIGALRRYMREDPIDEEHALMDDIKAIGTGGHYLSRKSTRTFSRTEIWQPEVFQRGTFNAFVDKPLTEQAVEQAEEILTNYEPAPLPAGAEERIQGVLDEWGAMEASA